MRESISCIYCIINKETGKFYIGSTINFNKRKISHLERLNKETHHSYKLQEEWNPDCFDFIILEYVEDNVNLINREQWWINTTNPYYNISPLASSSLGIKRRPETIEKVRLANLGLKHPEWRNKIKSLAMRGEKHWTKKKKYSDESRRKMSESQKRLHKSGYVHPALGTKFSEERRLLQSTYKRKPIVQYTLDGVLVKEWKSIKEASEYGFNTKYVIWCLKHGYKSYKNSIWKYKEKSLST